jgi:hypothetical protein
MKHHWLCWRAAAVTMLVLTVAIAACSSAPGPSARDDVKVTGVTVGRTLEPDDTIGSKTNSFWTSDTFYVSVQTTGSGPSATLTARWTFEDGKVAAEATKTISPSGTLVTALQASKEGGWPVGTYKVEVLLDGVSAGPPQEIYTRG